MGDRIRILTANLWNGSANPELLVALIRRLEIDVALLQELTHEQAEAIQSELPHGELEPATDCTGMGIALRRPGELSRIELPCRDARVASLHPEDWTGFKSKLEIINTHIAAPHVFPPWRIFPHRRKQIEGLIEYLDSNPKQPTILAGDLNATPRWPAYRSLNSRLTDAVSEFAKVQNATPGNTWGPWHEAPRLLRIDHVFVREMQVQMARTVTVPGSDHSGIVAQFSPAERLLRPEQVLGTRR